MISQDTIRNILDTARIDDVISDFVSLKKRGANYLGLCPFHNEKTPSFTVSPSKGIYKCFGCGKAGDVVRFVMEHDQMNYPEALKFLAGKYNIEVEETGFSPVDKEAESLKESLYLINKYAMDYFEKELWESEKGQAIALSYLKERGFEDRTIRQFNLGYNPEDWDGFSKSAVEKGYKKDLLEKAGVTIVKEDRLIDRFRARVIFPIHNLSGRVIGFGGRSLKTDSKMAKYVNSPESEIYSKSHQLYGLYFAKKSIVQKDVCYIVEGYTDVVSLFESGIDNAVAPLGTSLTGDQVKLIRRYTKNVVLLFDGDEAGAKASLRAIDMVLEEGMNVKVVVFPPGEDPDSYSKSHSDEELVEFLKHAEKDFISYRLTAAGEEELRDPIKKNQVLKDILISISKVPDHLLRSLLIKDLSQKADIKEQTAIYELNRLRRNFLQKKVQGNTELPEPEVQLPTATPQEEGSKKLRSPDFKEEKIVQLLFKYGTDLLHLKLPDSDEKMEVSVSDYIIAELEKDEIKFRIAKYSKVYDFFREKYHNSEAVDQKELLEHEDDDIRMFSYELSLERYPLSENWEKMYHISTKKEEADLKNSIDKAIYSLKLSEVLHRLDDLEAHMKEAGEDEVEELMRKTQMLSEAKRALADKLGMTLT